MCRFVFISLCFAALLLSSCSLDLPDDVQAAYSALPDGLDYNLHVKPILADKCFACHGPDKAMQKADLRLDVPAVAFASLARNPSKVAIDPGNPNGSELFHRILSNDPAYMMPEPTSHLTLSSTEKATLIKWISEGAVYKPHWSFVKPQMPDVPEAMGEGQAINAIDRFVLNRLRTEQLQPSAQANKELLLRRVSLDLTGLPPTLEEIDSFIKDDSPDAYEKQVDRLLASPHYGEKMAVDWLDLARFADSHGYTVDRLRDMSPYRDWVIQAFNENLPYDKFIHWQLGGDLMPEASKDMIIATAFNRNHQQNMEGGIIEEEFQTEYVVDRTNTFGDAFLGLSLSCAKCHDHKFDPISQKNYFEFYSFFNNIREAGQISWDDALPGPAMMLPTEAQEKTIRFIEQTIADQQRKLGQTRINGGAAYEKWLASGAYKRLLREAIPRTGLIAHYDFEAQNLKSSVHPTQHGVMKQQSGVEHPQFSKEQNGYALTFNGDVWLDLNEVGVFRKSEPFSVGLWVHIPEDLEEGVLFHKSLAERLYNFRGYHLYLKDDRLEVSIAHTAPANAITRVSTQPVPRDRWIHLAMTYDGSSSASGLALYQDGSELALTTVMDHLTKDILFKMEQQPGLQVGAWDRGFGFKGGKVDDLVVYDRELTAFEVKILARQASWRSQLSASADAPALKDYYFSVADPEVRKVRDQLRKSRTRLADAVEPVDELMIMRELPQRKKAFVLERGNYDSPGEEVFPNTPDFILQFPADLPKNRYGLARWLTHPDHPLTARVAVNRYWQNFFGTGLVRTTEDFGAQGALPSHPELLDWLALTFRDSGWDLKALNKLIVMSATYRQDSWVSPEGREKDPDNRLLSRGPSLRLTAEMLRDNALAASGLMNRQIGGKSIKPYQPDHLWAINSTTYAPDTGAAVYRRSLYVLVKRSIPNPTLSTFDAGSRSYCVVRRQATNTPLQSLVMLNDPTFVEAARVIGAQMAESPDLQTAIVHAFKKLTGRTPSDKEVHVLNELREVQLKAFQKSPEKAKGWLHTGQHKISGNQDALVVAANAVLASTIMNADASLTKR